MQKAGGEWGADGHCSAVMQCVPGWHLPDTITVKGTMGAGGILILDNKKTS